MAGYFHVGSYGTFIGLNADALGTGFNNVTAIGNEAMVNASNKVVIGNNVAGMVIGGYANWSNLSDGRVKENIREDVPGLSFITRLKPVTYTINLEKLDNLIMQCMPDSLKARYHDKDRYDAAKTEIHTGFVAQEVEELAQSIGYQFDGVNHPKNPSDNYSIAYSQFIMPLVKAVQEQQATIEELQKRIIALEQKQSKRGKKGAYR
jgi:hypothetical protein